MLQQFDLTQTDPEFMAVFEAFANQEAVNEPGVELDETSRYLAILASLIASQGVEVFEQVLTLALKSALSPVMVKEIVYQAVAYLGYGRVYPFLLATNRVMAALEITLPLEGQATTTMKDRREKGTQVQMDIFGPNMKDFWRGGHINRWLAANCFGDYYTRKGLNLKLRELITFCLLASLGGSEPQLRSHVIGNINLGNDQKYLIKVVSQILPYIGYPRSLNAIKCINQTFEKE